jgi:ubiquitin-protein ligase
MQQPIPGLEVFPDADDSSVWHVRLQGAQATIYDGEEYTLRVKFTNNYPMESPEVVFEPPVPVHPHIYGNGHICLSILYVYSRACICEHIHAVHATPSAPGTHFQRARAYVSIYMLCTRRLLRLVLTFNARVQIR